MEPAWSSAQTSEVLGTRLRTSRTAIKTAKTIGSSRRTGKAGPTPPPSETWHYIVNSPVQPTVHQVCNKVAAPRAENQPLTRDCQRPVATYAVATPGRAVFLALPSPRTKGLRAAPPGERYFAPRKAGLMQPFPRAAKVVLGWDRAGGQKAARSWLRGRGKGASAQGRGRGEGGRRAKTGQGGGPWAS